MFGDEEEEQEEEEESKTELGVCVCVCVCVCMCVCVCACESKITTYSLRRLVNLSNVPLASAVIALEARVLKRVWYYKKKKMFGKPFCELATVQQYSRSSHIQLLKGRDG